MAEKGLHCLGERRCSWLGDIMDDFAAVASPSLRSHVDTRAAHVLGDVE